MKDFKCLAEKAVFLSLKLKSNEYVRICLQCRLSVICVKTLFWIGLVTFSCHSLYYWCFRKSIIMKSLSIFSVFIKRCDVFMLTWYVVEKVKTLYNSGYRNLESLWEWSEDSDKLVWNAGVPWHAWLCSTPHELAQLGVTVPPLTLGAQMTAADLLLPLQWSLGCVCWRFLIL